MMSDKLFIRGLVKQHYPEEYERIHGKGKDLNLMSENYTNKQLKDQCKEKKIGYFNAMSRQELLKVINLHNEGNLEEVKSLTDQVKDRYLKTRKFPSKQAD